MNNSNTVVEKEEIERIFHNFALEAQKQISANFQQPRKKVIVIAGPTATGKSSFALKLAETIGGEIVSADSMQVYRGMDIGTAKPNAKERESVAHHLIDIRDLNETYNVVDFYFEARQACQLILSKNKIPIIVGGTGFYIHSLIYGPPSGPPSSPEIRKQLEEECQELGVEALYKRLEQLDLPYAHSITKNDKQKIIRALEIIKITGKKVSKLPWKSKKKMQNYDFRCWYLYRPRENLYKRIEERCDLMISEGLLEEVINLEKNGLKENTSASQAIGYKQALEYLRTERTSEDFNQFVQKFKQASRQYAKRQESWFSKYSQKPVFNWVDLDLHDDEMIKQLIINDYEMGL